MADEEKYSWRAMPAPSSKGSYKEMPNDFDPNLDSGFDIKGELLKQFIDPEIIKNYGYIILENF